jgi:glucosylglycerate synthase
MNFIFREEAKPADLVEKIGRKDILVGIPSFKNQDTIKYVVEVAAEGLKKYFPNYSCVIMNSDGDSPDNTKKMVEEATVGENTVKIISVYSGISGKGSAFRNIFQISKDLSVKGCVVVDSDLRSITPEWIKLLLEPIMKDELDYITPLYIRHKFDGTITNNFVYPLTRALYGYDIRQPIGGDFGFSTRLLEHYLSQDIWETDIARYGIDIWMTTVASAEGFRIGQAALGAKIHDAKDPSQSLGPMFRQVVGTCFSMAKQYVDRWFGVDKVQELPLVGKAFEKEPEPVSASYDPLIVKFNDGYKKYQEDWKKYLSAENFQLVQDIKAGISGKSFDITNEQWARLVYDYMVFYNREPQNGEHILDTLTPLYFVKIADFINKSMDKNTDESERMIVEQANAFVREKEYLKKAWAAVTV